VDLITVTDVRNEGLSTSDANDARVLFLIGLAGQYIHIVTGQVFESLAYTSDRPLLVDGSGIDALPLPMPVLELLTVSEDDAPLAIDEIAVYSSWRPSDDRRYPRLVKKPFAWPGGYASRFGRIMTADWSRGPQNVALTGTFGYLDGMWRGTWNGATAYSVGDTVLYNGQTYIARASSTNVVPGGDNGVTWTVGAAPLPIKRVAIDLVLREYRLKTDPDYVIATSKGRVKSETTDRHSYTLSGLVATSGLTGDPNIDDVLSMYQQRYGGTTAGAGQGG
jgi:hypothetical protein